MKKCHNHIGGSDIGEILYLIFLHFCTYWYQDCVVCQWSDDVMWETMEQGGSKELPHRQQAGGVSTTPAKQTVRSLPQTIKHSWTLTRYLTLRKEMEANT